MNSYRWSRNDVKQTGFNSKAQMRYLLMMLREYPSEYGWVAKVLKEHGVPSTDGPLHTYWQAPYQKSPKTPSYVYKGKSKKKKADLVDRLLTLGAELHIRNLSAQKVEDLVQVLHKGNPKQAMHAFWSIWGNDIRADRRKPEALQNWVDKFDKFLDQYELSELDRVEAHRCLGDRILGRVVG